jgi:hypothetical protein
MSDAIDKKVKELQEDPAALKQYVEAAQATEGLLGEATEELEKSEPVKEETPEVTFNKKKYTVDPAVFTGIPGHPDRKFTVKDLKENTVKVLARLKRDGEKKEMSLCDYLLHRKAVLHLKD